MLDPNKNAALHAFDILMTRFMVVFHQYSVEFVKSYKIRASIGENTIKFLITDLSIFRRKIGETRSDDRKLRNDR
ncbi:MAG: hypothetical protein B7X58_05210 [Marinobacter sp. 34-60-7]|nr:MAG: hypothetical protein B7X58_05210 [Marinobacter sp. 34-60-7]